MSYARSSVNKEIADYVTSAVDDNGLEKALRYWRIL